MVVSKSRSSASLTVMAPVPAFIANGRFSSPSPSVFPLVIDQVRPDVSPVALTVTTAELAAVVSDIDADVSVTVGAVSVMVTVNRVVALEPSSLVALMSTVQEAPVFSLSGDVATDTTPLLVPTVNIPAQDWALTSYDTTFVVPSSSDAEAVMPTVVPAAAFSVTAFAVPSVSDGPETSNSSTSFTLTVT